MSSDLFRFFEEYGPNFERQCRQKSVKYCIDLEDVMQEAAYVYLARIKKYDPAKGALSDFLWGCLNKRLLAFSYGPLRFAESLDDDSEHGMAVRNEAWAIPVERTPDAMETDRAAVPAKFEKIYIFAESIPGQSSTQLAKLWSVTPRRVNQFIRQICSQVAAARLNYSSQNGDPLTIRCPSSRRRQNKTK